MIRGTTPTHTFNTAVDLTGAEVVYVTYKQANTTMVEKAKADCTITSSTVTVTLSQEDTLKFNTSDVEIQIRARYPNGTAIASNIMRTSVSKVLKSGVI